MRILLLLLLLASSLLHAQERARFRAGPVAVRFSEGSTHGFLELRADNDSVIGSGTLLQVPKDKYVESRLILSFHDGSRFEETTRYTQHQTFRVLWYRLVQRGPVFERDLDATLESSGRWIVKTKSHKDGDVDSTSGQLELPEDFANGLPLVMAKNLRLGDTSEVHVVAFTPKPRIIGLQVASAGRDSLLHGGERLAVAHYLLKPKVGGVAGFFGKLLGKIPPDSEMWIVTDDVPTFLAFRGPMYTGPIWRLRLAAPRWPR
jgi:hypothetical protein